MEQPINQGNESDLKKLMEENLAVTKEILKLTKKVRSFLLWQQIFGVVKIVIILIPIILGILYLPPLLKDLFGTYQELLDLKPDLDVKGLDSLDLKNLPPEIQKYLK
ncbi:MAG: hypothetical protein MUC28_01245 [Planctomycetes bacterium]|jgi:hypothetical protein|nr:hypothetical protein [Planctomycetota bacterium]